MKGNLCKVDITKRHIYESKRKKKIGKGEYLMIFSD